jgi:hypothetical protein
MESDRIREQRAMAASIGMVLVTVSDSIREASIRSTAGPDRTGWTAAAQVFLAP